MKRLFFIILLCACFFAGYAQENKATKEPAANRHMGFEVAAGYSVPMGKYASSDPQDKRSGFAAGGWMAQLTYDWMGKKDLGLAIQYTYQKNALKNGYSLAFPNGIPDSANPASWSDHYLLMGPVFMKTIGKLHVDARILGGAMVSAGSVFDTPDPTDTTGFKHNKNIATGFAYEVAAGAGYMISSHVAFKFSLVLMGGWPGKNKQYGSQFVGYKKYTDPLTGLPYYNAVYSAPVTYEIKKVVTTLNPAFGIVFRF